MRVLLALLVVAAPPLVVRHSREAPFTLKVPAAWVYKDATYPSDHSTEFWRAPGGRWRVEVRVSACVGCAQPPSCVLKGTGCRPAPELLVPVKGARVVKLDRWRVRYEKGTRSGLVVVLRDAKGVAGFARVDVYLRSRSVARAILASFRIS
jgi:hypothetical protein